jgi:hypothetical protein
LVWEKPRVSHLKVFCLVYSARVPDEKHNKLDSKCKKLMFTGYSDHDIAYRLVDIDADKGIFNQDVVIDENASLFPSKSDHK